MIDTAEKRRSVAGIPFWVGLGVTPNALKDAEWRQQVGWGYSGIPVGAAVVVVTRLTRSTKATQRITIDARSNIQNPNTARRIR